MGVDAARQDQPAGGVDHPVGGSLEPLRRGVPRRPADEGLPRKTDHDRKAEPVEIADFREQREVVLQSFPETDAGVNDNRLARDARGDEIRRAYLGEA